MAADIPSKDMLIVGITGSFGKTTVGWLVRGIMVREHLKPAVCARSGVHAARAWRGYFTLPLWHRPAPEHACRMAALQQLAQAAGLQGWSVSLPPSAAWAHRACPALHAWPRACACTCVRRRRRGC